MKFLIGCTRGEFDSNDAITLVQRLVPLARIYSQAWQRCHIVGGSKDALSDARRTMYDITNMVYAEILRFTGDYQYDIECQLKKQTQLGNEPQGDQ